MFVFVEINIYIFQLADAFLSDLKTCIQILKVFVY